MSKKNPSQKATKPKKPRVAKRPAQHQANAGFFHTPAVIERLGGTRVVAIGDMHDDPKLDKDRFRWCGQFVDFMRSEEHTSELQSLMRILYAVFCLQKKQMNKHKTHDNYK